MLKFGLELITGSECVCMCVLQCVAIYLEAPRKDMNMLDICRHGWNANTNLNTTTTIIITLHCNPNNCAYNICQ